MTNDRALGKPTKVTMQDVARSAGVSTATVSRVISGQPTVRATHRTRVEAAIRELGYRPNRLARNLRKQRTDMIGLVVSDIENPYFAEMIYAAEAEAYRYGYRVLLCNTDENREKQAAYLRVLADERPLGVLLAPCDPAGAEIAQLLDLGVSVVAFDRSVVDARADSVLADNVGASRLAVDHLLQTGHRHIAFIGTTPAVQTGAERLAGYRAAMSAAAFEPRWENGAFRIESAESATSRLLEKWPDTDAIIAGNNIVAVGVLKELRRRAVLIPDDLGFVCFDDPAWAELVDPPLTVIAHPLRAMVAASVRLLIDRIEGRSRQAQRLVFGLDLKIRQSSRPTSTGSEIRNRQSPLGDSGDPSAPYHAAVSAGDGDSSGSQGTVRREVT